jgi:large subunit ribosomal protein L28
MPITMAKECVVTKKSSLIGGKYANRTRATIFTPTGSIRRYANLQKKRVFVPELNKTVVVTISPQGLRTIKKNGAYATLKKAGAIK